MWPTVSLISWIGTPLLLMIDTADEDHLAMLAQRVEETIRARGLAEVPSHEVGLAILGPLRDLDEVAYLRFASVYRGFESLDDFEKAITELRSRRPADADDTDSSKAHRVHDG